MYGASRGVQCLDISHALHLLVGKSLDDHSRGACAQMDIAKYYDSIPTVLVAQDVVAKAAVQYPERVQEYTATMAAVVRVQMLPVVKGIFASAKGSCNRSPPRIRSEAR